MSLVILKPALITPAMLDSSIPEDDYPAWSDAETYADEVRVIYNHTIWQSLQADNTGKNPEASVTWWVEVGPTNRMRAFDLSHSTKTRFSESAWFEITPGVPCNAIAFLEMDGVRTVKVTMTDPAYGVVYEKEVTLLTTPMISSWYEWTFGERLERSSLNLLDLSSYRYATIRIEITSAADAGIGVIMIGTQQEIGMGVLAGVQMGIRDYSRKETNEWGDVVLQQRAYSKLRSIQVLIKNENLDTIDRTLSSIRATPILWLISNKREQVNVYGWYSDYSIGIQYTNNSELSIQIEGLT